VSAYARKIPDVVAETERKQSAYRPVRGLPRPPGSYSGIPPWLLPYRLAWRQLRAEPPRLFAAVAGVMFASILVLMQLGFRNALFETATALPMALRGELFLINPLTTALFRAEPLPRSRAFQALAVPEVEEVAPIYLAQLFWRNPNTGTHRAIQVIGFNTESGAVGITGLARLSGALKRDNAVAFDALSRPEFGGILGLLARDGVVKAQLGNHEVDVIGTVSLGTSFGADGSVVMNEATFRRVVPDFAPSDTSIVALRLKPNSDPLTVQRELTRLLPHDVEVVTRQQLLQREKDFWDAATPIGVIFLFCTLMALTVGMVIVYQILFTDVTNHLRESATLKAIGFTNMYLNKVVIGEAFMLGCLGFVPGALACVLLYRIAGHAAYLNLVLTSERCFTVLLMIIGMCVFAGLLALRKLRQADPAEIF
jgi:putative ABC transport system permease protein